jgi:hypothetical protein
MDKLTFKYFSFVKICFLTLVLVFATNGSSLTLASEVKTPKIHEVPIIEGAAEVREMNFERARLEATSNGMKNAVRSLIMELMDKVPQEKEELINTLINNNYEKYIHGYRILSEVINKNLFTNSMSVELFVSEIQKDLLGLELKIGKKDPAIFVLIDEKVSPLYSEDNFMTLFSVSEDAILKEMIKLGWDVFGREQVLKMKMAEGELRDAINGDKQRAILAGKAIKADYLLLGTATKRETEENVFEITFKIYSVEEEKMISGKTVTGTFKSEDAFMASAQALRNAGAETAIYFDETLKKLMPAKEKISVDNQVQPKE